MAKPGNYNEMRYCKNKGILSILFNCRIEPVGAALVAGGRNGEDVLYLLQAADPMHPLRHTYM